MQFTGTFAALNDTSTGLLLRARQSVEVILTNTGGHPWAVVLETVPQGTNGRVVVQTWTGNTTSTLWQNDTAKDVMVYLRASILDVADGDTIAYTIQDTVPTNAVAVVCTSPSKVGATSGWVVGAADDKGKVATIPASQTSSTLVMRLPRLKIGDRIVGFYLVGSLQSAGNAATILGDLRSLTAATAGATDASVAVMAAALSVTANTIVGKANTQVKNVDHVVADGESFYALVTSTTGASCTGELQAVVLQIVPAATFG